MADEASGDADAVLAAVEHVDIDRLPRLREATTAASALHEQADRLRVYDAISAQTATALLGQVVAARRHAEAQRLDLTRPLNAVVKKINDAATRTTAPLKTIEHDLKAKLLAYQREQERQAAEQQARQAAEAERRRQAEEAQRRAAEQAARAEREAATRAAAQAEAAERRAHEQRISERAHHLAVEMSGLSLPQLNDIAEGSDDLRRVAAARREVEQREALREATQAAQAARVRATTAREAEQTARATPALQIAAPKPVAPTPLVGGGARVSARKRWTYEMGDPSDFARIPDTYKQIDSAAVRAAIRDGVRNIPGLRIYQEDEASVTL